MTKPSPKDATPDDLVKEALEDFEEAEDNEAENRTHYLDDTRFAKLDEQWPEEIKNKRAEDRRPCLTINKLRPVIKQVVNDARQNSPSIKVHPADSDADPMTAEIYNGLIRNIETTSKADVAYDTALDCAVTGGFGYFRISTRHSDDDTFDLDLCIDAIPDPLTVYGDPASSCSDSADWNRAFVTEVLRKSVFEDKYKGAVAVDWDSDYHTLGSPWCTDDSVMVAEYWKRVQVPRKILMLSTGEVVGEDDYAAGQELFQSLGITPVGARVVQSHKVTQYLLTGAEVLETNPWAGRYIPIVPVYGEEINVEGVRHLWSLIRSAKDSQRNFNYWRTSATEMVALAPKAPFIGPVGAFLTDQEKWESANTDNHAFIEYDGPVPPQRQPYAGPAAGAIQEALNAADDIKAATGLFNEAMGLQSNASSGKAILARQREGDVSTFNFTDNLSRAIEHAGRILIDLIPTVYTGDRMIRVLGRDGKAQNVQLGQAPAPPPGIPGQPAQPQQQPGQPQPGQPQPGAAPMQGGSNIDLTRIYDLSVGKYDLTVESGPSYTTQREEAANQMIEFVRSFPQAAPVIGDLLAKALDWPDADIIAKRLEAMLPPALKGQDPAVQQIQAQAQAHVQALTQQAHEAIGQQGAQLQQLQQQLQALQAQLQATKADQTVKAAKVQVDQYKAETDRIEAAHQIAQDQSAALAHGQAQAGMFAPNPALSAPVPQPPGSGY